MEEDQNIIAHREDLEENAHFWQKEIEESQEKLWGFIFVLRAFCILFAVGTIVFFIGNIFTLSWLQIIGTALLIFDGLIGIGLIIRYIASYNIRNYHKRLREGKYYYTKIQKHLEDFDKQFLNPVQYKNALPNLITSYRRRADRYQNWFIAIQLFVIFLSAAVTSLSGGWLDRYANLPWLVPVFSAIVSILTTISLFFKFREKGSNLQQTADEMDLQRTACSLGIGDYKGMDKKDALTLLIERTEALREAQQKRQQQLEQSSQAEEKALHAKGRDTAI